MSKPEESPNWRKYKKLLFLEHDHHVSCGKEGFPKNREGTFEIVTTWGEHLTNVSVHPGSVKDYPSWDTSRSKLKPKSRAHIGGKLITEENVAGWRRMS